MMNYHRLSALKQHRLITLQWWRAGAGHSIPALDLGTYQVKAKVVLAWLWLGSAAPAALQLLFLTHRWLEIALQLQERGPRLLAHC